MIPDIAEGKSCGECGMCCKLLGVAAIDKPPLSWCGHFKRGLGCRIYEGRPAACADFVCYWMHAPNLDETWRPDRAGFVMHVSDQGRVMNIEVDPARAGAWRAEPFRTQLAAWATQGAARAMDLLAGRAATAAGWGRAARPTWAWSALPRARFAAAELSMTPPAVPA